jgi:lipopolysaccharide/colanic/teichoic acid biosynthesis glycosyltransferase
MSSGELSGANPTVALGRARSAQRRSLRRAVDLGVAVVALVALAPLCALIAAAIVLEGGGGPMFTQARVGRGGRLFSILKFRTMVGGCAESVDRDAPLSQRRDDPRCTRVGRVLRRTHLDELPQLLNVLVGDMTLVGPRPLVPAEDVIVNRAWAQRRAEQPGLTGAWQVLRSEQRTVAELVALDRAYLAQRSAWRDLVVLVRTLGCIARGAGR